MNINEVAFQKILKDNLIPAFKLCGTISLVKDENDSFFYRPQSEYNNVKNLDFISYRDRDNNPIKITETDEFCKFKLDLPKEKGDYIWVLHETGEIIYIGETVNLYTRFNSGYGQISPRNCYKGGQATNIKMNLAVVSIYKQKRSIDIYYITVPNHKEIEKILLAEITKTKYNRKDNK